MTVTFYVLLAGDAISFNTTCLGLAVYEDDRLARVSCNNGAEAVRRGDLLQEVADHALPAMAPATRKGMSRRLESTGNAMSAVRWQHAGGGLGPMTGEMFTHLLTIYGATEPGSAKGGG